VARQPMARRPPRFMRRCSSGASCPGPISSIPVFWTPNSWSRVKPTTAWISWGPYASTITGRPGAGAGFDAQHFQIDWDQQHATCPAGKTSISWTPAIDNRENPVVKVKFSTKDCRCCEQVTQYIRSKKRYHRRTLTIRPQPQYQTLQTARQREATEAFQAAYARRAGIEGTISRETRSLRLRRTRYIGLRRVHLGHILAAVGLNVLRLGEWLLEMARAKTRITPFARLMADAAAA
jgi:hypothetical protein